MCHVIPVRLRNDQLITVCVQGEGKRSSKVVRSGNTDFLNFMKRQEHDGKVEKLRPG